MVPLEISNRFSEFFFLWLNDLSSQINVTWGGFHNKLNIHATHCVEIADSSACIVWNITIGDLQLMSFWSWKSFFFCLLIVIGQLVDRKWRGKERGGYGIRKGLRAKVQTRDAQRAIALYLYCTICCPQGYWRQTKILCLWSISSPHFTPWFQMQKIAQ